MDINGLYVLWKMYSVRSERPWLEITFYRSIRQNFSRHVAQFPNTTFALAQSSSQKYIAALSPPHMHTRVHAYTGTTTAPRNAINVAWSTSDFPSISFRKLFLLLSRSHFSSLFLRLSRSLSLYFRLCIRLSSLSILSHSWKGFGISVNISNEEKLSPYKSDRIPQVTLECVHSFPVCTLAMHIHTHRTHRYIE